ncbi:MAG: ABC transporter substrate-binding protein [Synergistales bacterium]|nr:ABC transporter substrate-binding protein [Synergistales bacterium]
MKRIAFVLLAALILACFAMPAMASEKVFVFGRGGDAVRLDPADITDGESYKVCMLVFETLVQFKDGSTMVEPALAKSWDVSDDGLVWTFHLREGVTFHDGTPFTADAVVFSLERQMNPDHPGHKGDFAYWSYMYSQIESVEAVDDYTVRISLDKPYAPFLSNMACFPVMIVSPHSMLEMGVEDFRTHPVGTGPYEFVEWKKNDRIVLKAYDDYWGGRRKVDRIIYRSIPDNTTRMMALLAGEIDAMDGISAQNIKTLKQENPEDIKLLASPGMNTGYMAMNMTKEPFGNLKVRKAVAYAINKKRLVKEIYQGMAKPANQMLPPTLWGYNRDIEDYGYDPEKARKLLAEAGYPDGFETELWYMPVPRQYMPDGKLVAQAIQQDLAEVGVDVELVTYDWGTYLEKLEELEHTMCLIGWMGDNGDPDNFMYVLLDKDNAQKGSAQNYAVWKNEEYHELMMEGQTTMAQEEREALYIQSAELMHQDVPVIPIANAYNLALVNTAKVDNFKLHPILKFILADIDINQ